MPVALGWVGDGGLKLTSTQVAMREIAPGLRGEIYGFSRAARRRLTDRLMAVPWNDIVTSDPHSLLQYGLLLTLTYPRDFPSDFQEYKRHLRNFHRALEHDCPINYGAIWRLEYQKRGAPHYHILLVFDERINVAQFREWVRDTWYRVVSSGNPLHLKHGTDVRVLRQNKCSNAGLMFYLIKYLGKEQANDIHTGRIWGGWGDLAQVIRAAVVFETTGAWIEFLRRLRRWGKNSRYLKRLKSPRGIRIFGDGGPCLCQLIRGIKGVRVFDV